MSHCAYIRLTTEEFCRVFPQRFRTEKQAIAYAEHKLQFWLEVEDYGSIQDDRPANCTYRIGRVRPIVKGE